MNFGHHKLPQRMPTVSFTDTHMFLRTHNKFNDSRQKKLSPVDVTTLSAAQETRFAISADNVRRVFA